MSDTPEQTAPVEDAPQSAQASDGAPSELEQMKDQLMRALADSDNARRRAEREASEARIYAIDRFARDLLAVADNLGRALQSVSPEQRAVGDDSLRNVLEGVELTEKALIEVFGRHGLRRVGGRGDRFDPNYHQAVAQIPSEVPSGLVAEVFQPGYILGERIVRPAMVAVSLGAAANESPPPADGGGTVDIKV
jgi:molecular chaperone GrpE